MPKYRRIKAEGGTYFFTVNTEKRRPILTAAIARQALREAIIKTRKTFPFTIQAWVLLPDHLHTIWTLPPEDANFSSRWAMIKQYMSKACAQLMYDFEGLSRSKLDRKEKGVWQRRFWEHLIRDDDDFAKHMDYIHWNPVKHGYVPRVVDWPYSTFHKLVAQGVYLPDWGGCVESWDEAHFGE
jgi:putative transposase